METLPSAPISQPYFGILLDTVSSIENLPVLSEHHQRLRQLVSDDDARIEEVVEVLERDPAFTANLIRIANSPVYGQRVTVDSVQRAVQVIGFKGVGDMSLTLEVVQGFGFPAGIDMQKFWDHAVGVALLSKQVAQANGDPGDAAYLVGLLHDVGLLVLASFVPDAFALLMAGVGRDGNVFDVAREQFDCTHVDVSCRMMEMWSFPEDTIQALRRVGSPRLQLAAVPTRSADRVPERLAMAVINAHAIACDYEGSFEWDVLPPAHEDVAMSQSRDFEFASGIGAAILSCCK